MDTASYSTSVAALLLSFFLGPLGISGALLRKGYGALGKAAFGLSITKWVLLPLVIIMWVTAFALAVSGAGQDNKEETAVETETGAVAVAMATAAVAKLLGAICIVSIILAALSFFKVKKM